MRSNLLLRVLFATLFAALGVRAAAADTFPYVVFAAKKVAGGPVELYAADVTGLQVVKLSGPLVAGGNVEFFRWSPNRKLVAFTADKDTDEVTELYVVPVAGGEPVKVSGPLALNGDVDKFLWAWSPTSKHLAYRADQSADTAVELFVSTADGKSNVQVSGASVLNGDVESFEWARNGSRLAYRADLAANGTYEIYVASPDGKTNVKVSPPLTNGGNTEDFRWAPNGSRLAVRADDDGDGRIDLFVCSPDGKKNVRVSAELVAGGAVGAFAWAPNGSKIAYRADQETDGVFELYVSSADGKKNGKLSGLLVANGNVDPTRWSWDSKGSRLAYCADQELEGTTELYVSTADGKTKKKVSGPLTVGGDVGGFAWSPKGARLAYESDQNADEVHRLWVSTPDAKSNTEVSGSISTAYDVDPATLLWPKKGDRVSYVIKNGTGASVSLRVADADGDDSIAVVGPLGSGGEVLEHRWDSKGTSLVFWSDKDVNGQYELYRVDPAGGASVKLSGTSAAGAFGVHFFEVR